jgi:hypothetical protein
MANLLEKLTVAASTYDLLRSPNNGLNSVNDTTFNVIQRTYNAQITDATDCCITINNLDIIYSEANTFLSTNQDAAYSEVEYVLIQTVITSRISPHK